MPTPRRSAKDWYRVEARAAAADEGASADVYIYDEIGDSWWGGISARVFAQDLDGLDVETIRLFINSPGGDAWDGVAIMNTLRRHKARVEVTVDGLAASAASVIAMAGDHISMNRGAEMMIHDAWGFAVGNAQAMRETADALAKLSDSLADTYAARAGGGREKWRALMEAETWYTAEEAVLAGLADEWVDAPAAAASFDLSKFAFAGRAHAPAPRLELPKLPASEPGDPNRKEEVAMSDNLAAGLRERLGVTDADASDEQLLAAVDEVLARPQAATTTTVPEGTVLLDRAALDELRAAAEDGRTARAEQDRVRRDGIVARAIEEGRIAPASRAAWREQLDANEQGTSALLDSLMKNLVPVVELGHSDEPSTDDDRAYAKAWGADEKKGA